MCGPKAASARRPRSGSPQRWPRWAFRCGRLKTGTPPRIDRRPSIDERDERAAPERGSAASSRIAAARVRGAAAVVLGHAHQRRDARARAGEPAPLAALRTRFDPRHRPALLSFDRRQGHQVRPQSDPSDLHRARRLGRTDALRRRLFDLAAGRGAARDAANAARTRERARCCGRATRWNTISSSRPSSIRVVRDAPYRRTLSLRAAQRYVGLRRGRGAGACRRNQRRATCARRAPFVSRDGLVYRDDDRRPRDEGSRRAVPDADLARRASRTASA